MPTYMIVYAKITDRDKFLRGYAPAAAKLVARFGGKYVIRAPAAAVLEGDLDTGMSVVISEWPDKATVLEFWNSPEYREAKKLREGVAECQVTIVTSPPGKSADE